jgi:hypothetical protein
MKGLGSDLVSFAFNSQVKLNKRTPLYIDADCPSRSLNASQTRTLVRKLIAGFRDAGLRRGDRVVVHLFNNVRKLDLLSLEGHRYRAAGLDLPKLTSS